MTPPYNVDNILSPQPEVSSDSVKHINKDFVCICLTTLVACRVSLKNNALFKAQYKHESALTHNGQINYLKLRLTYVRRKIPWVF